MMKKPRNAIGYTRLSDLRIDDDNGNGNADQEKSIRARAKRLGWRIGRVIVENDLSPGRGRVRAASAFKRRMVKLPDGTRALRTVRPGFREVLAELAAGRADGLIALDLDRAVRDPRDLEDLIDVVEQHHVPVESVTGSLRLANDADITMARVMVAVANKSSRDTARRVASARLRQAENGQYGGGKRPYGFEADGVTVRPSEAAEVAAASAAIMSGVPLRQVARDMQRRGVATVTGVPWAAPALRDMLLRPRNAAIMVYRGEEIGPAPWPALVSEDVFRGVVSRLTDPGRTTTPGPAAKWFGSGLYLCACGQPMRASGRQDGRTGYRCAARADQTGDRHVTIGADDLDEFVIAVIIERLGRPDAIDLIGTPGGDVDVPALRAQTDVLRQRLDAFATDYAEGAIDRRQMLAGTKRVKGRLAELERQLSQAAGTSPLAPLVGADDVAAAWSRLTFGAKRAVLAELMTVRVLPSPRPGSRTFDPERVEITWRTG